jgi:hypothetical protein
MKSTVIGCWGEGEQKGGISPDDRQFVISVSKSPANSLEVPSKLAELVVDNGTDR